MIPQDRPRGSRQSPHLWQTRPEVGHPHPGGQAGGVRSSACTGKVRRSFGPKNGPQDDNGSNAGTDGCCEVLRTIKDPPAGFREGFQLVRWLGANYVCRLKALRALEQVKLHGFTLIQGAIAVLLDGGEVYEHVLTCRALDESISFRPVEPLHSSFLSHGKNSFH